MLQKWRKIEKLGGTPHFRKRKHWGVEDEGAQLRLEQHQPKGRLGIPYEKHFAVGNRITVQLRAILVCSV
jgi:hypothetical protein